MSEYVLHRNHTHRSLTGHIINFVKGVPVYVPPVCRAEVVAIGAVSTDGESVDPLGPEATQPVQLTDDERRAKIVETFPLLEKRNNRTDFTGNGVPSITAVKKIVDFDLTKLELEDLWRAYQEEKGA